MDTRTLAFDLERHAGSGLASDARHALTRMQAAVGALETALEQLRYDGCDIATAASDLEVAIRAREADFRADIDAAHQPVPDWLDVSDLRALAGRES